MTWMEYTNLLVPLLSHFGPNGVYSINNVRSGFNIWKNKPKDELLTLINESISSGVKFDLNIDYKAKDIVKLTSHPSRRIYKHDEITGISDEYLSNYLKQKGAESLIDLLNKTREELRKAT